MRNMPWVVGFSSHSNRLLWMSQNESQLGISLARVGPKKVGVMHCGNYWAG